MLDQAGVYNTRGCSRHIPTRKRVPTPQRLVFFKTTYTHTFAKKLFLLFFLIYTHPNQNFSLHAQPFLHPLYVFKLSHKLIELQAGLKHRWILLCGCLLCAWSILDWNNGPTWFWFRGKQHDVGWLWCIPKGTQKNSCYFNGRANNPGVHAF